MMYDPGTLFGLLALFTALLYLVVEVRLHMARRDKNAEPPKKVEVHVPAPPQPFRRRETFSRKDFLPYPYREAA